MRRTLRIWLALGVIALAAPASASIAMAFHPLDFSGLSGSILLSSYARSPVALRLPGSVSAVSIYTEPGSIQSAPTQILGGRIEWRNDRFAIALVGRSSGSAFGRRAFYWTPGDPSHLPQSSEAIPEPGAALLFAVGTGIVALRLRGGRRPA